MHLNKKKNLFSKFGPLLLILVAIFLSQGCASSTKIFSDPVGARVILDGKKDLGKTPVQFDELAMVWTEHRLTVKKKGYITKTKKISPKFSPANIAACICTLGILWPALFVGEYEEFIVVSLEEKPKKENASLQEQPQISFGD